MAFIYSYLGMYESVMESGKKKNTGKNIEFGRSNQNRSAKR